MYEPSAFKRAEKKYEQKQAEKTPKSIDLTNLKIEKVATRATYDKHAVFTVSTPNAAGAIRGLANRPAKLGSEKAIKASADMILEQVRKMREQQKKAQEEKKGQ